MTDLIKRLEEATEGSRALDCRIQNDAVSWRTDRASPTPYMPSDEDLPHYSSSLDAALTLVPEGWERHNIKAAVVGGVVVEIRQPSECGWSQGPPVYSGEHPNSEAIAATLAALRALPYKEHKP